MAAFCEGKDALGNHISSLTPMLRRRLQRHQRNPVAIAQVMVLRDDHAVAQSAFAQRGLEVGNALVAIRGIIFAGTDRRRRLASTRLILADPR